jgi:hypothetical protein
MRVIEALNIVRRSLTMTHTYRIGGSQQAAAVRVILIRNGSSCQWPHTHHEASAI